MKKTLLIGLSLIVLIVCVVGATLLFMGSRGPVCMSQHMGNFIGCMLAPQLALSIEISGSVDEVRVVRAGDDLVVGRYTTNGQDISPILYLSTLDKYYLVIQKGEQTRYGTPHGFPTNQTSDQIRIFAIDNWEGPL